jgi:hypothetical protein
VPSVGGPALESEVAPPSDGRGGDPGAA